MRTRIIVTLVLLLAPALPAAMFTVINTNNSGTGSLRQAVFDAAANPGTDTIDFAPELSGQTITLASQIAMNMVSAGPLTVDASSLTGGLTLSGGGICRVIHVNKGGTTNTVTLIGLTLTGGNGTGGSLSGIGGAVYVEAGSLTLDRCVLSGNSTNFGGAISYSSDSVLVLQRSSFLGNTAAVQGGAIYNNGYATLLQCTLSGNQGPGSAIYSSGGGNTLQLTQCTISGNPGNAIVNTFGAMMALTHCTIAANPNTGISNSNATATLTNCIVAANGSDISSFGQAPPFGSTTTITRVGANIVQSHINSGTATDSGPAAINADPLLAPLGHYGGPTQTMALLRGSPARDAAVGSTFTYDQRDFPRSVEGDDISGAVEDIGAYEASTFDPNYLAFIWERLPATALVADHDPAEDYDDDGESNEEEWVMGSDPDSGAVGGSALAIMANSGSIITASILRRHDHRTYELEQSATLQPGSWIPVTGAKPLHGQGNETWEFPKPANRMFYHLKVTVE